jgi:glycogen phosphorylase
MPASTSALVRTQPSDASPPHTGNEAEAMRAAILNKLHYAVSKTPIAASQRDWLIATSLAVRDQIVERWIKATEDMYESGRKRVYYLSLEFLIGRLLLDALSNLGKTEVVREALAGLGVELETLRQLEPDAALGNGGLGRLAACFMESMATLSIAAHGYGIRYDHGMFRQVIKDGWQTEYPENWLSFGNPWEFERPETAYPIGFGGSVTADMDDDGEPRQVWIPAEIVEAVAYDTPICGWRGTHVNTLRLWSARASDPLRLEAFNRGDYVGALSERMRLEAISKVLYPSDSTPAGQELRLRQEFFFVSASLQDLIRRHLKQHGDIRTLADKAAIQLNDTHPAMAVAELMRVLVDVHGIGWKEAWTITRGTLNYTNHTLLPEALESWSVPLVERLLPRHMQIIYLINAYHLDELREEGHGEALISATSLIDENNGRRVRMGALAFLGAGKVNGVSALHSELMKETVFRDLHIVHPERITNKTNGITFRRWLHQSNPGLTRILCNAVGPEVLDNPERLQDLAAMSGDGALQDKLMAARQANKVRLAQLIKERMRIAVDPKAMFDVQIKRIHEYKRQLLNILETVALYDSIRSQPMKNWVPRVKIFGGKAAASYHQAKMIIKLANDVAKVVNSDPTLRGLLKVVFLPNYNVSLAESIIPAADLSEQISTAGMEASGTGNMKFALNGALTIGTLDGANIEIAEHVGRNNIFIFGMTAQEVTERRNVTINAREFVNRSPILSEVIDAIRMGVFSPDDPGRYRDFLDSVVEHDHFMVLADFDAYYARQRDVDDLWRKPKAWWKSSIENTARMAWFSSDRTISEYAEEIWHVSLGQKR